MSLAFKIGLGFMFIGIGVLLSALGTQMDGGNPTLQIHGGFLFLLGGFVLVLLG